MPRLLLLVRHGLTDWNEQGRLLGRSDVPLNERGRTQAEVLGDALSSLAPGEILGVVSTNALELGVDIGSLDVAVLAGYPGSVAGTWQQLGRAGRRTPYRLPR